MLVTRRGRFVPRRPNEEWCMDFVADQLTNGQRFRVLTIVDLFSLEALAIQVGQSLRGERGCGRRLQPEPPANPAVQSVHLP